MGFFSDIIDDIFGGDDGESQPETVVTTASTLQSGDVSVPVTVEVFVPAADVEKAAKVQGEYNLKISEKYNKTLSDFFEDILSFSKEVKESKEENSNKFIKYSIIFGGIYFLVKGKIK